ncbi:MAG TPA: thiamine pyrophosphate-binding protein [Polyangiaceae bacterium]
MTTASLPPEPAVASDSVPPSAATVLLKGLARHGVRVAFGIPGGTISPLFAALKNVPELRYIAMRHEAMAAFAALGHARATGMPAIVLTTSGPGLLNAFTGITAALLEELPLILISGEVSWRAAARGALQDGTTAGLDAHAMMRTVTRWSGALTATEGARGVAERAWQAATSAPPGPVFITAAIDVASSPVADVVSLSWARSPREQPDRDACRIAASKLATARRPLLVLGNGSRNASRQARALAERTMCPVAVTGHAKGVFPEAHPLYLGIVGAGQHPSAVSYIEDRPDVVCVVGSRLGDIATNGWTLEIGGTKDTIQIDRNPWLIGRNAPVTIGIVGDSARVLEVMAEELPRSVARPLRVISGCRSVREELATSSAVPLKPQRVLKALAETFPGATWCCDIGEHLTMALHYLRVDEPSRFHAMVGLGSMGSGIGTAIGIREAFPDRRVVAICGDGGLAMFAGDLLTCVENEIGVVFAVFNDGRWNMVEHGFRVVHGEVPRGFPSRMPDLAMVARGFGANALRISSLDGLTLLQSYGNTRSPLVLDIQIDPTESVSRDTRAASMRHFAHPER